MSDANGSRLLPAYVKFSRSTWASVGSLSESTLAAVSPGAPAAAGSAGLGPAGFTAGAVGLAAATCAGAGAPADARGLAAAVPAGLVSAGFAAAAPDCAGLPESPL